MIAMIFEYTLDPDDRAIREEYLRESARLREPLPGVDGLPWAAACSPATGCGWPRSSATTARTTETRRRLTAVAYTADERGTSCMT
jgi:hypothetical protein